MIHIYLESYFLANCHQSKISDAGQLYNRQIRGSETATANHTPEEMRKKSIAEETPQTSALMQIVKNCSKMTSLSLVKFNGVRANA